MREYYIDYIRMEKYGLGECIKRVGPMSKEKANRWFNALDIQRVKPDFGYAIQMWSKEPVEADFSTTFDMYMEHGFIPIYDIDETVHRVWSCPAGYSNGDSYDVYELSEILEEQKKGCEIAFQDGRFEPRFERYLERTRFTNWLIKQAYRAICCYNPDK